MKQCLLLFVMQMLEVEESQRDAEELGGAMGQAEDL